jgi:hypothetical protein
MRTWYGLSFDVTLLDSHWCTVGPLLPHPQLVNGVIRRGLGKEDSVRLMLLHELGHGQSLPAVLLYGGLLYSLSLPLVPAVLSLTVLWELLSEAYVVYREGRNYIAIYRALLPV